MTADASRPGEGPGSAAQRWKPDWLKKPTGDDLAWAYPERANRLGVDGKAVLECQVAVDGRLANCQVTQESPADMGFAKAALALAPQFQMTPPPPGRTEPARVTIPLVFSVPVSDSEPEAAAAAMAQPAARPPAPLGVLLADTREGLAHQIKALPPSAAPIAATAALVIVLGLVLRHWKRRDDGKDLTGPNSDWRR